MIEEKTAPWRKELYDLINQLKERLGKLVDFDALWKSESTLLEKLDEVTGALMKKLADKAETKKALVFIEKKVNQLFSFFQGPKEKNEDGLFVTRPLGWSCASCSKDLDRFSGRLGEFRHWAVFPPKETSPERMGRFGTGYKNMYDKQKQQQDSEKEKMRMTSSAYDRHFGPSALQSPQNEQTLPNIRKEDAKRKNIINTPN